MPILKLSIQRAWIGGANGRGFQLSKEQLYPQLNIENTKSRIYEMNRNEFSTEEQLTMRFFEKSYEIGFPKKRFFTFNEFEEVKEIGNR